MAAPILIGFVPSWISVWLTPLWLIGVGAAVALVILLLMWGVLLVISRRAAASVPLAISEGVLTPILAMVCLLALLGVGGTFMVIRPHEYYQSIVRYPSTGTISKEVKIGEPQDGPEGVRPQEVAIEIIGDELSQFTVRSANSLIVSSVPNDDDVSEILFQTNGGEDFVWSRQSSTTNPILGKVYDKLLITNLGDTATTLTLGLETTPLHPEVSAIPWVALSIVAVVLLHMVLRVAIPKISAIALATTKSEIVQPIYLLLLVMGAVLLYLFIFIPYHTFGEDIKVLKSSGLTLIMVFGIIQAVWAASNAIADELEGRTALTVLSKPIGRRQFVIGKFVGILWSVFLMFILLGTLFLFIVSYKVIFEARESSLPEPEWQVCFLEVVQTIPGLILGFLEAVVLTAISVAISTRLPMLPNAMICFSIYVAGHLTPLIVQSSLGNFEPVQFVGQFIATVFPVLEYFNSDAAVAAGRTVPISYLGVSLLYCALYSTIAMLLALALFEDRDIA